MDDLISRQSVIDAIRKEYAGIHDANIDGDFLADEIEFIITKVPSVQIRKKGRWILVKGSNGKDYHKCSYCLHTQEITGVKNYCSVCGAKMEGAE